MSLLPRLILDTSVLVHAVRRDRVWDRIQGEHQLFLATPTPIACVVSVGELRSLALLHGWGKRKLDQMAFLLGYFPLADINHPDVIEAYAALDSHFQRRGHAMGKNDLWIAATTVAMGARLLTCDRDFDALDPLFLTRSWIDPS